MSALKNTVKKLAVAKQTSKYNSLLKSKNTDYDAWIRNLESSKKEEKQIFGQKVKCLTNGFEIIPFEGNMQERDRKLAESEPLCKLIEEFESSDDINCRTQHVVCAPNALPQVLEAVGNEKIAPKDIILQFAEGEISLNSLKKISGAFLSNKNLILIYFDEDTINAVKHRDNPWFKPDWAPDDFLSYFYFGGAVALRTEALIEIPYESDESIYSYINRVLKLNGAFDTHGKNNVVQHIPEVLYHTGVPSYEVIKDMKLPETGFSLPKNALVSIVIPSKDHPDVLLRCIKSLKDITVLPEGVNYEIIVVDNGSNENNREQISNFLKEYEASYIYEERQFNFSYMCNLGAKNAKGNYLLFLNDDMEIAEADWLTKMLSKAALDYAGAVGAKLLYPDSTKIQHAGITNLRIGPAHKLQFLSDDEDHYYGRNRYVHDVLAVTGACLLVKKEIFDEVGGFDEKLAVAFNDVDLCYRIYEKGYYNIVRCDTILFHHESLSRGNDALSKEKQKRLNQEKDYLYEKHQNLYGVDPFYNVNLTTDMWELEYAPKYHYEVKLNADWARVSRNTDVIKRARYDECVRVGMECAMDIFKWKYGVPVEKSSITPTPDDLGYYFQGYTFVIGADNACYERALILENTETGEFYTVEVELEYRPDIAKNVPDQLNVDLAGYTAKIASDSLPKGHYQFGMYMKDKTSTLRLYNMSNWEIDI